MKLKFCSNIPAPTFQWIGLLLGISCLFFFSFCGKKEVEPVEIYPEDICSFCRMAISDPKFAGEIIIENTTEILKFDDIACLVSYKNKIDSNKDLFTFVHDFKTGEWIKFEAAVFVLAEEFQTPMGSGLVSFKNESDAKEFLKNENGEIVSLDDLSKGIEASK